ncbi:MAG: hypothetical protein A2355_11650 [Spirochaetes bacterium RIFOXYB1_FULL_32_8]|nr:MAG: hypothetical protein A2355_11650 [Spirochaetes bacterium RIFOXYB1_FULL_32_8]
MRSKKNISVIYNTGLVIVLILIHTTCAPKILTEKKEIKKSIFESKKTGKDATVDITEKDDIEALENEKKAIKPAKKVIKKIKPIISKNKSFDNIEWVQVDEKKDVLLFMQENTSEENNHYKAEKIINGNKGDQLYKNLTNFEIYPTIFPKTLLYKKIKLISRNKYLVYCQINFKPFKNRDYYIVLQKRIQIKQNSKEWIIEWSPVSRLSGNLPDIKGFTRVTELSGRWKIIEKDNRTKISVELYNDFNLPVVKSFALPFEKTATFDTLNQLVNYSIGSK